MVSIQDDPSKEFKKLIKKFQESKTENSKFLIYDLLNLKVAESIGKVDLKKIIKEISFYTKSREISLINIESILEDIYEEKKRKNILYWLNNFFVFLSQNEQKSKKGYSKNKKSLKTKSQTIKEQSYHLYRDFNIKIIILENLNYFTLNRVKNIETPPVKNLNNQNLINSKGIITSLNSYSPKIDSMTLILFFIFYSTNSLEYKAELFWDLIDFRKQGYISSSDNFFFALLKKLLSFQLFFPDIMLNDLLYKTDDTKLETINMSINTKDFLGLPFNSTESILYTYNSHVNRFKANLFYAKSIKYTMQDFTSYFSHNFFFVENVTDPKLTKSKYITLLKEQDYRLFDTSFIRDYFHNYIQLHNENVIIFKKEIKRIFLFCDKITASNNYSETSKTELLEKKYIFSGIINELGLRDDYDKLLALVRSGNYFCFVKKFRHEEIIQKKKRRSILKQMPLTINFSESISKPLISKKSGIKDSKGNTRTSFELDFKDETEKKLRSKSFNFILTNFSFKRSSSDENSTSSKPSLIKEPSFLKCKSNNLPKFCGFSDKSIKEKNPEDLTIKKIEITSQSSQSIIEEFSEKEEEENILKESVCNVTSKEKINKTTKQIEEDTSELKEVNHSKNKSLDEQYIEVKTIENVLKPKYEKDCDDSDRSTLSQHDNLGLEFMIDNLEKSIVSNSNSKNLKNYPNDVNNIFKEERSEDLLLNLNLSPPILKDDSYDFNLEEKNGINNLNSNSIESESCKKFEIHSEVIHSCKEISLDLNVINLTYSSEISHIQTKNIQNKSKENLISKLKEYFFSVKKSEPINLIKKAAYTKEKSDSKLNSQTIHLEQFDLSSNFKKYEIYEGIISNSFQNNPEKIVSKDYSLPQGYNERNKNFSLETKKFTNLEISNLSGSFSQNMEYLKQKESNESQILIFSGLRKIENEIKSLNDNEFNIVEIINNLESNKISKLDDNINSILKISNHYKLEEFIHIPHPCEILKFFDSHPNIKVFDLYIWMLSKYTDKRSNSVIVDLQFFKILQNDFHNKERNFNLTINAYEEILFDKEKLFFTNFSNENNNLQQFLIVPILFENFSEPKNETIIIAQFDFLNNIIIFYDTPDVLNSDPSIGKITF